MNHFTFYSEDETPGNTVFHDVTDVTDLMCDPLPPIKPSNADIASELKTLEQFALFINEDKTSNFLGHIHYLKNVCDTERIPRVQSTIDNFFK